MQSSTPLDPVGEYEFVGLRLGVAFRFTGGLVFKAQRLLYHSTLGLRVIKKKKKVSV